MCFVVFLRETLPKEQGLLTNDTAYAPDFFTCSEVERFDRTAKRVVREIRDEYQMT